MVESFPILRAVVLDTPDARATAEFYRQLLGYHYRPGDEMPPACEPDDKGQDWLVLLDSADQPRMSFQQEPELVPTTWPLHDVPMRIHIDFTVSTEDELAESLERALRLGATMLMDRSEDPDEPLYVLADPAGHPFCLFIG